MDKEKTVTVKGMNEMSQLSFILSIVCMCLGTCLVLTSASTNKIVAGALVFQVGHIALLSIINDKK